MFSVIRRILFQKMMDILVFLKTFVDYDLFPEGLKDDGISIMGICVRGHTGGVVLAKVDDDFNMNLFNLLMDNLSAEWLEAIEPLGVFADGTYSYVTTNGFGDDLLIVLTRKNGEVAMWSPKSKSFFLKTQSA